jgi:hypothetical protein
MIKVEPIKNGKYLYGILFDNEQIINCFNNYDEIISELYYDKLNDIIKLKLLDNNIYDGKYVKYFYLNIII